MNFDLSEEQRLLKESLERLMRDACNFERRNRFMHTPEGFSRDLWAQYADMGLLALPFPEDCGGIGGGPVETMLTMEAFGRAAALEPYLATVVLAGGLLRRGGSTEQLSALVPAIASGEKLMAFGHTEPRSRYDLFHVETEAKRDGGSFSLSGEKGVVLNADTADAIIVTARTAGSSRDQGGVGLFLLDAKAPGVSRRGYPTQDGRRAAELVLDNVRVGPEGVIGDPENALPLVEQVAAEAIAALAADSVGAMDEMLKLTVDYLNTRKQFGQTIGSFQVLQHRASEMYISFEQARSMAMLATMTAQDEDSVERGKSAAAAKVQIGRSARFIGESAIQLHGGVGMTMEYKVGHLFKRAIMNDVLFGDADHHSAQLAAAGGLIAA